jgi:hypothetical protein
VNESIKEPSTPQKQSIKITAQKSTPVGKTTATLLTFDENEFQDDSKENLGISTPLTPTNLFSITPAVRKVYHIIQKSTGALGGNGYAGAIYGELTMNSMQKVRRISTI